MNPVAPHVAAAGSQVDKWENSWLEDYNKFIINDKTITDDAMYIRFLEIVNSINHEINVNHIITNNIENGYIAKYTDTINFWRFIADRKTTINNKLIEINRELIKHLRNNSGS